MFWRWGNIWMIWLKLSGFCFYQWFHYVCILQRVPSNNESELPCYSGSVEWRWVQWWRWIRRGARGYREMVVGDVRPEKSNGRYEEKKSYSGLVKTAAATRTPTMAAEVRPASTRLERGQYMLEFHQTGDGCVSEGASVKQDVFIFRLPENAKAMTVGQGDDVQSLVKLLLFSNAFVRKHIL
eukprot:235126_1